MDRESNERLKGIKQSGQLSTSEQSGMEVTITDQDCTTGKSDPVMNLSGVSGILAGLINDLTDREMMSHQDSSLQSRQLSTPTSVDEEIEPEQNPFSHQIGGDHYHKGSIQPIEYILANDRFL